MVRRALVLEGFSDYSLPSSLPEPSASASASSSSSSSQELHHTSSRTRSDGKGSLQTVSHAPPSLIYCCNYRKAPLLHHAIESTAARTCTCTCISYSFSHYITNHRHSLSLTVLYNTRGSSAHRWMQIMRLHRASLYGQASLWGCVTSRHSLTHSLIHSLTHSLSLSLSLLLCVCVSCFTLLSKSFFFVSLK